MIANFTEMILFVGTSLIFKNWKILTLEIKKKCLKLNG